ncbi:carbohydrate kinase family protein [Candidatus Peregrinibacteria bacterium]|nr:carbohydrate kinase family protein [Candidatus Peregrinibacteria bacterium]MBI3816795.1 carbohydrate kinase family protein [Candidatus Peregrinibacteria bacterium]
MTHILVTGSIAYDLLLGYDGSFRDAIDPSDLEHLSVSFFSPHFARHHGGTGANIAWNLKLLVQNPLLVSSVGADGEAYLALLRERGIDTSRIEVRSDCVTATAIIGTDTGERQIAFFHPGADAHASWPADLADQREEFVHAIVSPRDPTAMMQAVRWCRVWKVPYLFDPGQQVIALSRDELVSAIEGAAGVIANTYEWSLLSEKVGVSTSKLLDLTPLLIVTAGEEGLTIYRRKEPAIILPACRPDALVNPTGAGDALRAGVLAGLASGWDLRQCGMLGASIASFVVEREGTLLDHVDIDDIFGRAEETYGERLPELTMDN